MLFFLRRFLFLFLSNFISHLVVVQPRGRTQDMVSVVLIFPPIAGWRFVSWLLLNGTLARCFRYFCWWLPDSSKRLAANSFA